MIDWIWTTIGFAIGALASGVLYLLTFEKYYVGALRKDSSIPGESYYFMEIEKDRFERLKKNKFALLVIKEENYMKQTEP